MNKRSDDLPRTLDGLAEADEPLALPLLSLDPDMLRHVQERLAQHGLLDPPADGYLGPVTTGAIARAAALVGAPFKGGLAPAVARALLGDAPMLPLAPGEGLAGQLVRALLRRGDWICRVPGSFAIAYVEATEPDGSASAHRVNAFDDARFLLRMEPGGAPSLAGAWVATTRSGETGVEDPVDRLGPPRLEPSQHKAWVMGRTAIGTELEQDALVQVSPLPVRRDETKDYQREGGPHQVGLFVIDQHGAMDAPREEVGDTAVGCLVARSQDEHRAFLDLLRQDPRWRANNAYRFQTSLLTRDDWDAAGLG